MHGENLKLRK